MNHSLASCSLWTPCSAFFLLGKFAGHRKHPPSSSWFTAPSISKFWTKEHNHVCFARMSDLTWTQWKLIRLAPDAEQVFHFWPGIWYYMTSVPETGCVMVGKLLKLSRAQVSMSEQGESISTIGTVVGISTQDGHSLAHHKHSLLCRSLGQKKGSFSFIWISFSLFVKRWQKSVLYSYYNSWMNMAYVNSLSIKYHIKCKNTCNKWILRDDWGEQ